MKFHRYALLLFILAAAPLAFAGGGPGLYELPLYGKDDVVGTVST